MSTATMSPIGSISGSLSAMGSMGGTISRELDHDYYTGDYEVTPRMDEQTLATSDRLLTKDIIVKEVPYSEVKNEAGGTTINIAYIE